MFFWHWHAGILCCRNKVDNECEEVECADDSSEYSFTTNVALAVDMFPGEQTIVY